MSDVTGYGQGYDRRDVVPKTKTEKIKLLQLSAMSVWGNVLESDCDVLMQT